jgi:hypothetical protein
VDIAIDAVEQAQALVSPQDAKSKEFTVAQDALAALRQRFNHSDSVGEAEVSASSTQAATSAGCKSIVSMWTCPSSNPHLIAKKSKKPTKSAKKPAQVKRALVKAGAVKASVAKPKVAAKVNVKLNPSLLQLLPAPATTTKSSLPQSAARIKTLLENAGFLNESKGKAIVLAAYRKRMSQAVVDVEAELDAECSVNSCRSIYSRLQSNKLVSACELGQLYSRIQAVHGNGRKTGAHEWVEKNIDDSIVGKTVDNHIHVFDNACAVPVFYFLGGLAPSHLYWSTLLEGFPSDLMKKLEDLAAYLIDAQYKEEKKSKNKQQQNIPKRPLPAVLRIWQQRRLEAK